MTTDGLIAVDLAVSVVAAAAWLGAGASAAARRPRVALALLGVAILTSVARGIMVLLLAGAGWWFGQEQAMLAVGLVGVGLAFVAPSGMDLGGGAAGGQGQHHAVPVTALRGPTMPGQGGSVRRFTLTARTATVRLTSGREVQAWTFDGQVP